MQAQREITIEGAVTNVDDGIIMSLSSWDGLTGKTIAWTPSKAVKLVKPL